MVASSSVGNFVNRGQSAVADAAAASEVEDPQLDVCWDICSEPRSSWIRNALLTLALVGWVLRGLDNELTMSSALPLLVGAIEDTRRFERAVQGRYAVCAVCAERKRTEVLCGWC
jgi:hypothetical protein